MSTCNAHRMGVGSNPLNDEEDDQEVVSIMIHDEVCRKFRTVGLSEIMLSTVTHDTRTVPHIIGMRRNDPADSLQFVRLSGREQEQISNHSEY